MQGPGNRNARGAPGSGTLGGAVAAGALVCALAAGCAPAQYASQADQAAYRAVADAQKAALGETRAFDVNYRPLAPDATEPDVIVLGSKVIRLRAGDAQPLTLGECLQIALRNSRSYQARKETLYASALGLANTRRGWTVPKLSGALAGDAKRTVAYPDVNPTYAGTAMLNPSLAQQLVDGGKITLAATLDMATDFLGQETSTFGSLLQANVTQPLLRGAWRGFAYEPVYRLERDFVYSVFEYERFRQTFAADVVRRYYSVLQQRDRLANEEANIQRLKETLALTRVLVGGGQVSPIQQDQAEQDLLNAQVRFEEDRQAYQDALDSLKLTMGLPIRAGVEVDYPAALEELVQIGPRLIPFQEDEAVEVAMTVRPDLLTGRAKVRDAARDVEMAADAFLPKLDFVLGYDVPGTEPRRFERIQFHHATEAESVAFNYSLDQTDNRDAYRKAILGAEKAKRDLEEFNDQVRLEVRQAYRALLQSRHSYELQQRNVEIARRRRKLAALQQKEGEASARDVLEAEESLRNAQNGLTSALVGYTTTRLAFLAALGMLDVDEEGRIYERTEPIRFDRIERRYPHAGSR